MSLAVICPAGHRFKAARGSEGQRANCPDCGRSVIVPAVPPPLPSSTTAPDREVLDSTPPKRPPKPPSVAPTNDPSNDRAQKTPGGKVEKPETAAPPAPPAPGLDTDRTPKWGRRILAMMGDGIRKTPNGRIAEFEAEDRNRAGYRADSSKVVGVRWLAVYLLLVAVLGAMPVLRNPNVFSAPWWTVAAVLIVGVQLVYIVWMVSLPDWSTVWVVMLVFAISAALYGCGLALALGARPTANTWFNLYPVRRLAVPWCTSMVLLTFLGAYLGGRFSSRWHRSWSTLANVKPDAN